MRFRNYDSLRTFVVVAKHLNLRTASLELHLTKGAISYQISKLESDLGFELFHRANRALVLTDKGGRLLHICRAAFSNIENEITAIKHSHTDAITIGMTTYFASRWLSPRLMRFTSTHPGVALRLQPTLGLVNPEDEHIDLLIRWGNGHWNDLEIEPLFTCPIIATGGRRIVDEVNNLGLDHALYQATLLHDSENSSAWRDWYQQAGLNYESKPSDLVIPDPNVRVQAVIDGQGIALNDYLVQSELAAERLFKISDCTLDGYGYFLAYRKHSLNKPMLNAFREWILTEANIT